MQLSTLIGKRILSQEGNELGYVIDVLFNKTRTKLCALVCADDDEEEFYLEEKALLSVGDVLVCRDVRCARPQGNGNPLSLRAYTDTGLSLGTVRDVAFEKDGTYLVCENGRYSVTGARFGHVIVVKTTAPRKKTKSPSRKATGTKSPEKKPEKTPSAGDLNRLNLLGRRLKKSVYDEDGNAIAYLGEIITPEILSTARRHNRLLQLTVNTLTNIL